MKINSKKLEALAPLKTRYSVSCGDGLTMRVHPSGRKSWVVRRYVSGRTVDQTIGHFPAMTLRAAQQKTRSLRKESGLSLPAGYTLEDAFRIWCRLKKGSIVSYKDERRRLETYVLKYLRHYPLDEITAPLVIQLVRPIERSGHLATLKRVIMRLREMLDFAVCAGYIDHNPISRISRIFPAPNVTPMPSLDWQSLEFVFAKLDTLPPKHKILFLWGLSSMLRPTEAAHTRRDWADGNTLYMPAEFMKMKRPHRVPLDQYTNWIFEQALALTPHKRSRFLFPGRTSSKPISSQTLAKALNKTPLNGRLVPHGLRSIGRTWMADQMIPFEVAESALAHLTGTAVTRAYMRSDYLEQRRSIMLEWRRYIFTCASRAGFFDDFPCPDLSLDD